MDVNKTIKDYAREAKKRLKSGYWQNYQQNLEERLAIAKNTGENEERIKEYFINKAQSDMRKKDISEEEFYQKVKAILEKEGQVSNFIGRLTDKDYFNSLSYEEKQRYTMDLSNRYLRALERYKKEQLIKA